MMMMMMMMMMITMKMMVMTKVVEVKAVMKMTMMITGFDFPRGPGAYAPRFCCGPLDFSD